MPSNTDTIAAIATATGRGGIGIVRVSGPRVRAIAAALLGGVPEPRRAEFRSFLDGEGEAIDAGLAIYFAAPRSFTGEDVLELHAHGGRVVLELLLERALELGARQARPGEFSERAYLNGKLDLAQTEAVADLIDSGTAQAARAALRSLRGEFSLRVTEIVEAITVLRAYVEASIDFPEEEVDFLSEGDVAGRLAGIRERFEALAAAAKQGSLLREGLTVVIAGCPNAGKSSLLNYLAGHEAAIVTDIPGTTRDLLHEHLSLDGLPLHLVDTAGLRESGDKVEQEGVRRAKHEMENADHVLLLADASQGLTSEDERIHKELPEGIPVTLVFNKIDLAALEPKREETQQGTRIYLSAKTGEGVGLLREHLKQAAGFAPVVEDALGARQRHLDALVRARTNLDAAATHVKARAGELLAEELRLAQGALGEITGEVTSEDLLGKIFASFCIGK